MSYEIKDMQFNTVQRLGWIAEVFGEILKDELGSLEISSNPYSPTTLTGDYKIQFAIENIDEKSVDNVSIEYAASEGDTTDSVIDGIVVLGNALSAGRFLLTAFKDYPEDVDKYFTIAPSNGYRILGAITIENLTRGSDLVSAPTGSPASYLSFGKQPTCGYPRLLIDSGNILDQHNHLNSGAVKVNGNYYPYHEAMADFRVSLRVESGDYQNVMTNGHLSAQDVLQRLRTKLGNYNIAKQVVEKVNGTFLSKPLPTIIPSPIIDGLNTMSIATSTITFNIIDRYVDINGSYVMEIDIEKGQFNIEDEEVMEVGLTKIIAPPLP